MKSTNLNLEKILDQINDFWMNKINYFPIQIVWTQFQIDFASKHIGWLPNLDLANISYHVNTSVFNLFFVFKNILEWFFSVNLKNFKFKNERQFRDTNKKNWGKKLGKIEWKDAKIEETDCCQSFKVIWIAREQSNFATT